MAMDAATRRAKGRAYSKERVAKRALAAGRVPGQIGRPPVVLSDEQRSVFAERKAARAKRSSEMSLKRRTAARAAKALAEGRVPGKSGGPRRLTDEQRIENRKATFAKYRETHRETIRAYQRAAQPAKRERQKARNPEAYRLSFVASEAGKRARAHGTVSEGGVSAAIRRVWLASGGKCAVCASSERLEIDHIVALANGGQNVESNFKILCMPCNRSKGAKDYSEWLAGRDLKEAA